MTTRIKLFMGLGAVLIGLMACVVIVALWFVANMALGNGMAMRRRCATNLKELGTVVATYAAQYNDQLTVFAGPGGSWMCDQPSNWPSMGAAAPGMSFPNINYCPANTHQDPAVLWGGPAAAYCVTGYVWTNDRPGMPPLAGLRPAPVLEYHQKFSISRGASEAELAVDWIISDKPAAAGAAWTGITAPGRPGIYDTSHLAGKTPAGGNDLMFDGHVEWRPFNPANATAVPQTPGGLSFWFPGK